MGFNSQQVYRASRLVVLAWLPLWAAAAQAPLPELRTEPTNGGSIFYVRNVASQPLTAFLIELVNYPGSSYSYWQDDVTSPPLSGGAEQRIPVANMTVGAVPDYVKIQAALYADGTSSGIPEKVTQLMERRRFSLETTRALIERLEKAQSAGTPKAPLTADLTQWADSLQPAGKAKRNSQAAINQAAARTLIADAAASLDGHSIDETLAVLRASERRATASKTAP
jgi:hypothetical protein